MNAYINQRRWLVALIVAALTLTVGSMDASAQLVNAGFDNAVPGPGVVGGFGTVVGPPFQPGFWGAENATILTAGAGPGGPVAPFSGPNMLEMRDDGLTVTQAWQVVNVGILPPNPAVSFSALFNASTSTPGVPVQGVVRIHTFTNVNGWPVSTQTSSQSLFLDSAVQTWESITLPLTPIPASTSYVLAELYLVNSTLISSNNRAYVDDARLTIGSIPEPSSIALAFGGLAGLAGVAQLRNRRKANTME